MTRCRCQCEPALISYNRARSISEVEGGGSPLTPAPSFYVLRTQHKSLPQVECGYGRRSATGQLLAVHFCSIHLQHQLTADHETDKRDCVQRHGPRRDCPRTFWPCKMQSLCMCRGVVWDDSCSCPRRLLDHEYDSRRRGDVCLSGRLLSVSFQAGGSRFATNCRGPQQMTQQSVGFSGSVNLLSRQSLAMAARIPAAELLVTSICPLPGLLSLHQVGRLVVKQVELCSVE